ncbi:MAG: hypothetical protein ACKO6F_06355 [Cyanobium sp.]
MPYEPGSPECRVLISCKSQIEAMLLALSRIENSEHIRNQLVSVHNQLEGLHELHRRQPSEAAVPPPGGPSDNASPPALSLG